MEGGVRGRSAAGAVAQFSSGDAQRAVWLHGQAFDAVHIFHLLSLSLPMKNEKKTNQTRFHKRQMGKKDPSRLLREKMTIFRHCHPTQQISGKQTGQHSVKSRDGAL